MGYIGKRIVSYVVIGLLITAVTHHTTAGAALAKGFSSGVSSLINDARATGITTSRAAQSSQAGIEVGFSPGNAEQLVVSSISDARNSIDVAAYSFTSAPIAKALVQAAKRGVQVRVVMDKSQRSERYSSATFLANSGIPVRINSRYAIMHNKFMVIDGQTVETGSFNFTRSAQARNAENVMILRNAADVATTYAREWSRLWAESDAYAARY